LANWGLFRNGKKLRKQKCIVSEEILLSECKHFSSMSYVLL